MKEPSANQTSSAIDEMNTREEFARALRSVFVLVRKHWPYLVASVLVAGIVSVLYSKSQTRIYQAQATIEIDPNVNSPLNGDKSNANSALGLDYFDNREYFETQLRLVTTSKVLETAATNAGLLGDYKFFGYTSPPANPPRIEAAVDRLRGMVSVETVRNTRHALIRVDDRDNARAAVLANAVANAFIEHNLQRAINSTSDAVVWLSSQVDSVKNDLEVNENSLHDFKKANNLPSISINETSNMIRQELTDYNTSLTRAREKRKELEARYGELSKILADDPEHLPASELLSNQFLSTLRTEYISTKKIRKSLMDEGRGENHPSVKAAEGKLVNAREALVAEIANIKNAVKRDLAIVTAEEVGKLALYEAAHKRAVDLGMKEIEYHRLDRSREQNEKIYALLLEHLKQADLTRMMKVNNIRVVEPAQAPGAPIRPRTMYNLSLGLFLGFVVGVLLMYIREMTDNRIKSPDDVEKGLGITFLGLLPTNMIQDSPVNRLRRRTATMSKKPELTVHEKPASIMAEAARSIRTNLMFTNPDKPYRNILVTSAAPAEGKTTVACSIAIALAQAGLRVCIMDCDLRRPRLHRIFDRRGDVGLTNILVGEATIEEAAKPTEVENLWSLPAGPIPPNPADIFHSERFKQVLKELSLHFDRIVIDSPPLVPVTDAAILSRLNDCVIFVLRSMKTPKMMARQGLRSLLDVDAHIAGCVLNDVDMNRGDYNYYDRYYYYKKGYGPAAQEDEEDDVPRRTESVNVRASNSDSMNAKVVHEGKDFRALEFDSEEAAMKYVDQKRQSRDQ